VLDKKKHVHFIGIGGYGMSAIASVLLDLNYKVTGSDIEESELLAKLREKGAVIQIGHREENIEGSDLVVYSSMILQDNVEIRAAKKLHKPILHRSKMLALLFNDKKGIAIAGTHGKTTTSSMIAQTIEYCKNDPTYIIGGEVIGLRGNARAGKGDFVVAEADESDSSFLEYKPFIAVVTNIEPDHLENYHGDFSKLKDAYISFVNKVKEEGSAILCTEDKGIVNILPYVTCKNIISYGFKDADVVAKDILSAKLEQRFNVFFKGKNLGEIRIKLLGKHNVLNSLASIATCLKLGLSFKDIKDALYNFRGVKRRFQILSNVKGITVVDDYAHHPTEVKTTLEGAKILGKRIVVVFQPHRYSRLYFFLDDFSKAFKAADEVIVSNIYAPCGEPVINGVSAKDLAVKISKNSDVVTKFIPEKGDILTYLKKNLKQGDLVITMGAGDIWKVSHELGSFLSEK